MDTPPPSLFLFPLLSYSVRRQVPFFFSLLSRNLKEVAPHDRDGPNQPITKRLPLFPHFSPKSTSPPSHIPHEIEEKNPSLPSPSSPNSKPSLFPSPPFFSIYLLEVARRGPTFFFFFFFHVEGVEVDFEGVFFAWSAVLSEVGLRAVFFLFPFSLLGDFFEVLDSFSYMY